MHDPHLDRDLRQTEVVKGILIEADRVVVEILLPYPAGGWVANLEAAARAALAERLAGRRLELLVRQRVHAHQVQEGLSPMPGVKNIIAVASGKGGVGKSTTAVNLALALQAEGARVGVLDADIYGPSIPQMLGLSGKPESPDGKTITPKRNHGLQAMSIGLLVGEDTPMIWRGPMVTQALQQLLTETAWDDLDYLVIDLPPGTGDIQLTLCQRVPLSAALIVTTPQDIALLDARKALQMFNKVSVPVLGIVENMAIHVCSSCGHAEHIFGSGGGERMAQQYGVPLLGSLPLDIRIREQADGGAPTVAAEPDSDLTARYRAIARCAAARLSEQGRSRAFGMPKIVIQNT
ncbi:iron-sulfur cluster carrier protein ApbC [Lysobacter sp. CAU 1642]|uniref:Iron-sulfur cluster carrier protein n=1 Tax=Pseudomarimonas salicorniae TaxID=2933270 RepID=A0ABT0GK15_9GAMM|nr:iron-sulfur cluster carrier protein ApbC [Lysobacter sp. CAU 1642]